MTVYTEKDVFMADKFPEMQQELSLLYTRLLPMPVYFKADIIISYLKDHRIKNEWIKANPELVEFLLHGSFISKHTEALFNFCRSMPVFCGAFEGYMKKTLLQ